MWNQPADDLSFSIAVAIQRLRARIEGRTPFFELYPHTERMMSYRIALSVAGTNIVPPHRDWREKAPLNDIQRTQATLYLSKHGTDYEGEGFKFETHQGKMMVLGRDEDIDPGDLVIWNYGNLHSVSNVRTSENQIGFIRMLLPPETIHGSKQSFNRLRAVLRDNKNFRKYILPKIKKMRSS